VNKEGNAVIICPFCGEVISEYELLKLLIRGIRERNPNLELEDNLESEEELRGTANKLCEMGPDLRNKHSDGTLFKTVKHRGCGNRFTVLYSAGRGLYIEVLEKVPGREVEAPY